LGAKHKLKKMLGQSNLKDYVINYFLDEENVKLSMEDLLKYGCQSGMVGSLIWYSDTCKFYNEYKEEINELASEFVSSTGYKSIFDVIPKLDKEDQLILEDYNKNMMAWFGFEETTYQLYEELFENREHSKDDLEI